MIRLAIIVGISLAAGVAIGAWLRPAETVTIRRTDAVTAQAGGAGSHADAEEISSLRARAAELRSGPASQSPRTAAAPPADAASLRTRRDELVAKKDGEGLLALIRECLRAGPEGYALALEIAVLLGDDEDSFSLNGEILERLEKGGLQPAITWALQHSEGLPAESLELAIWAAGLNPEDHAPDALRLLLALADTHPDGDIASSAASHLRRLPSSMDPELDAFVRRHAADSELLSNALTALAKHKYAGLDEIFSDLVASQRDNEATLVVLASRMGDSGTPASHALLASLARDARPLVSQEAGFQLIRLNPPVSGLLVERVWIRKADTPSILRRGDIVTACNGSAVVGQGDFWKYSRPGEAANRVTVRRGDELVELEVDTEELRQTSSSRARK